MIIFRKNNAKKKNNNINPIIITETELEIYTIKSLLKQKKNCLGEIHISNVSERLKNYIIFNFTAYHKIEISQLFEYISCTNNLFFDYNKLSLDIRFILDEIKDLLTDNITYINISI